MKRILLTGLLCVLTHSAQAAPSYALEGTHVHDIYANQLQRSYQIFIALPESYQTSTKRYPVLFVTDANYGFAVARNISQRLSKHAGLEEAIVVGLSYATGDTGVHSRRRDYTPSVPRGHTYRADMPGRAPVFGEAAAYGRFIVNQLFPVIAEQYRADMQRKVFVGHSYGSLLGLQLMLSQPRSFEHYILGSPSLWFDHGIMFEREKAYASKQRDLQASVFLGIGAKETLKPGQRRTRAEGEADMVEDLRDFSAALNARRYPGLRMQLKVFADEDHASVFPTVFTHGLRAYLKKQP